MGKKVYSARKKTKTPSILNPFSTHSIILTITSTFLALHYNALTLASLNGCWRSCVTVQPDFIGHCNYQLHDVWEQMSCQVQPDTLTEHWLWITTWLSDGIQQESHKIELVFCLVTQEYIYICTHRCKDVFKPVSEHKFCLVVVSELNPSWLCNLQTEKLIWCQWSNITGVCKWNHD